jgi:hypothetical protein
MPHLANLPKLEGLPHEIAAASKTRRYLLNEAEAIRYKLLKYQHNFRNIDWWTDAERLLAICQGDGTITGIRRAHALARAYIEQATASSPPELLRDLENPIIVFCVTEPLKHLASAQEILTTYGNLLILQVNPTNFCRHVLVSLNMTKEIQTPNLSINHKIKTTTPTATPPPTNAPTTESPPN